MANYYKSLTPTHIEFIGQQKMFFLASASQMEVNLSPKGLDALRVISPERLLFLDFPGSGNRTARDIRLGGRITLMCCAFEGNPLILRCFCKGRLVEPSDAEFAERLELFDENLRHRARRLVLLDVEAVETSCGWAVPQMEFKTERQLLTDWVDKKTLSGELQAYIDSHDQPVDLQEI
ncbi:MAG: hypothetical protein RIS47_816 [Bacteroidota bacterium]